MSTSDTMEILQHTSTTSNAGEAQHLPRASRPHRISRSNSAFLRAVNTDAFTMRFPDMYRNRKQSKGYHGVLEASRKDVLVTQSVSRFQRTNLLSLQSCLQECVIRCAEDCAVSGMLDVVTVERTSSVHRERHRATIVWNNDRSYEMTPCMRSMTGKYTSNTTGKYTLLPQTYHGAWYHVWE